MFPVSGKNMPETHLTEMTETAYPPIFYHICLFSCQLFCKVTQHATTTAGKC